MALARRALIICRPPARPAAWAKRAFPGLALLAWLVPMSFAVLAHTHLLVVSADELGMYRYTADIVAWLRDGIPIAWVVQLGPRYFPDLPISFAAYLLGLGEPRAWGAVFALLNQGLVYGALLLLLKVHEVPPRERSLIGLAFMAVMLLLVAMSFEGGKNLLHTTHHNTLIAPALLFYALPKLFARAPTWLYRVALLAGLGALFGLVIHANALLLAWAVAPALAAMLVMVLAGHLGWRELLAALGATVVALGIAAALRRGFDALPFLAHHEAELAQPIRIRDLGARLATLGVAYSGYGRGTVALLYGLALTGAAVSLVAGPRATDPARGLRLYAVLLCATTALAVPAAMVVKDLLSIRYLLWGIAVAALPIALGVADVCARLHPQRAALALAGAVLVLGTPWFMAQARAAAARATPYQTLADALEAAAAQGAIGREGLASYWVAHKVGTLADLSILPLGRNARPFFVGANVFRFWDWRDGCPQPRRFTFVVTTDSRLLKLEPSAIVERFGRPAAIVPVAGAGFEIWRYPDGIAAPERMYRAIADRLAGQGISTRPLARCNG